MHLIEVKRTWGLTLPESTLQEARERASRIRTAVDQLYHLVDQVNATGDRWAIPPVLHPVASKAPVFSRTIS